MLLSQACYIKEKSWGEALAHKLITYYYLRLRCAIKVLFMLGNLILMKISVLKHKSKEYIHFEM